MAIRHVAAAVLAGAVVVGGVSAPVALASPQSSEIAAHRSPSVDPPCGDRADLECKKDAMAALRTAHKAAIQQLTTDLKAARAAYRAADKSTPQARKAAQKARQAAIKKATVDYKAAMKVARDAYRAACPDDDGDDD